MKKRQKQFTTISLVSLIAMVMTITTGCGNADTTQSNGVTGTNKPTFVISARAAKAMKAASGKIKLTKAEIKDLDVNKDGKVTTLDALMILKEEAKK